MIGFKQFEEMYLNGTDEEKKWLKRAEKMFINLDFRNDSKFDARVGQLRSIYYGLYNLLSVLYKINIGTKPMSDDDFNKIPTKV